MDVDDGDGVDGRMSFLFHMFYGLCVNGIASLHTQKRTSTL